MMGVQAVGAAGAGVWIVARTALVAAGVRLTWRAPVGFFPCQGGGRAGGRGGAASGRGAQPYRGRLRRWPRLSDGRNRRAGEAGQVGGRQPPTAGHHPTEDLRRGCQRGRACLCLRSKPNKSYPFRDWGAQCAWTALRCLVFGGSCPLFGVALHARVVGLCGRLRGSCDAGLDGSFWVQCSASLLVPSGVIFSRFISGHGPPEPIPRGAGGVRYQPRGGLGRALRHTAAAPVTGALSCRQADKRRTGGMDPMLGRRSCRWLRQQSVRVPSSALDETIGHAV
jgi:hypothetical protein